MFVRVVGDGLFYCPHCRRIDIEYERKVAREWFTMYFFPCFPVGRNEFIECAECGTTYHLEVLDLEPPSKKTLFLQECYRDLRSGWSLEAVEMAIVEFGIPEDEAVAEIDKMTKGKVWQCDSCAAHYAKFVRLCPACEPTRPSARRDGY